MRFRVHLLCLLTVLFMIVPATHPAVAGKRDPEAAEAADIAAEAKRAAAELNREARRAGGAVKKEARRIARGLQKRNLTLGEALTAFMAADVEARKLLSEAARRHLREFRQRNDAACAAAKLGSPILRQCLVGTGGGGDKLEAGANAARASLHTTVSRSFARIQKAAAKTGCDATYHGCPGKSPHPADLDENGQLSIIDAHPAIDAYGGADGFVGIVVDPGFFFTEQELELCRDGQTIDSVDLGDGDAPVSAAFNGLAPGTYRVKYSGVEDHIDLGPVTRSLGTITISIPGKPEADPGGGGGGGNCDPANNAVTVGSTTLPQLTFRLATNTVNDPPLFSTDLIFADGDQPGSSSMLVAVRFTSGLPTGTLTIPAGSAGPNTVQFQYFNGQTTENTCFSGEVEILNVESLFGQSSGPNTGFSLPNGQVGPCFGGQPQDATIILCAPGGAAGRN